MTDPRLQELADETRAMIERAEKVKAERDAALQALKEARDWARERATADWLDRELADAGTEAKNCVQEAYESTADKFTEKIEGLTTGGEE